MKKVIQLFLLFAFLSTTSQASLSDVNYQNATSTVKDIVKNMLMDKLQINAKISEIRSKSLKISNDLIGEKPTLLILFSVRTVQDKRITIPRFKNPIIKNLSHSISASSDDVHLDLMYSF